MIILSMHSSIIKNLSGRDGNCYAYQQLLGPLFFNRLFLCANYYHSSEGRFFMDTQNKCRFNVGQSPCWE